MKKYDDSAQLLLLAGFAVGLGIVMLTIMLNNVIYASNIASESSIDTSRYDISNALEMTEEAFENAYRSATENGSINNATFQQELEAYAEMASNSYAISGHTFSVSYENNTLYEPYMTQNGLAGGEDDWTIVRNVNTTDEFVIDIIDVSKLGNSSNSLIITVTNSTGLLWSVEIYNASGNRYYTVTDHNLSTITNGTTPFEINATGDMSYQFASYTEGKDYSINVIGGSNAVARCTFSGNLTTGEPFTLVRHYVVNPTVTMRSSGMSITRSLPISLPGRVP